MVESAQEVVLKSVHVLMDLLVVIVNVYHVNVDFFKDDHFQFLRLID